MNKLLVFSILTIGFTSTAGQILVLRELMVVFFGNELSIGIVLAMWLFWVAIGSGLVGRLIKQKENEKENKNSRKIIDGQSAIQICLALNAVLLPLTILSIRLIRPTIGIPLGEIVGIFPMFYTSFIVLAPMCTLFGFSFVLAVKVLNQASIIKYQISNNEQSNNSAGKVYFYEAISASIGGILCNYIFIPFVSPFQTAFIISICNLLVAILLSPIPKLKDYRMPQLKPTLLLHNTIIIILTFLFIFTFILLFISTKVDFELITKKIGLKGLNLVHTKNSRYGNLSVISNDEQRSFYENGLLMFTVPDLLYAEEWSHFALLEHPNPEKVLLIGGGVGGLVDEILKYQSITKIDYVELDPTIIKIAKTYLTLNNIEDSRVNIINQDGRLFVKRTKEKYDVIIISLPEPHTTQLNRFYTREFFSEASEILSNDGIMFFGVTSSENYISKELGRFLICLYNTLKEVFPDVIIIPGDLNYFISAKQKGVLTYDSSILITRLKERNIETKYVREYYLPYKLSPDRVEQLQNTINKYKNVEINTDFKPISYFYDMILWTTKVTKLSSKFNDALISIANLKFIHLIIIVLIGAGIITFIMVIFKIRNPKFEIRNPLILLSVMTVGMTEMVIEITILISFQIIYGYVYSHISLIVSAYMIGLALGSGVVLKVTNRKSQIIDFKLFIILQALIGIYSIILFFTYTFMKGLSPNYILNALSVQLGFPILALISGFIGGVQFPLALKLYSKSSLLQGSTLQQEIGSEQRAGSIYAVDLVGASFGSAIFSSLLIPTIGIANISYLLCLINVIIALLLYMMLTTLHFFKR